MNNQNNEQIITPDEFHEYVQQNVDVRDSASIEAAAPMLKALSRNKDFLMETINEDIKDMQLQKKINPYSAPTFALSMGKNFLVRANIWPLEASDQKRRSFENGILVYGLPHDHNFDFLTVGYHGPGYETEMYEYDFDQVQGYVGEDVEIHYNETTTLPDGKIMFYRKSKDIHLQLPPKKLSVSLNLLTSTEQGDKSNQYIFDIKNKKISGFNQLNISTRVFLFDLAKAIGNENSIDAIESISKNSYCFRTRAYAINTLAELSPNDTKHFYQAAENDNHSLVRTPEGREMLINGI